MAFRGHVIGLALVAWSAKSLRAIGTDGCLSAELGLEAAWAAATAATRI